MKEINNIKKLFSRFAEMRVLVLGDLMLDSYLWGHVERISPESPVPVVEVEGEDHRPGGAGNVALNLRSLGAETTLLSLTGTDEAAGILEGLLKKAGIQARLIRDDSRPTTRKTRILGRNQQMLRVDREVRDYLSPELEAAVLDLFDDLIHNQKPDLILLQDYNKGFLTKKIIREVIQKANQNQIFTAVDPKSTHFFEFGGANLFKPNLKELSESMGLQADPGNHEDLRLSLEALRSRMPHAYTLLTLSEHGMVLFDGEELKHEAAHQRQVADVSGAGDTVISVAALAMAAGSEPHTAIRLANLAGGLVCEEVGVVPISPDKLEAEALRLTESK